MLLIANFHKAPGCGAQADCLMWTADKNSYNIFNLVYSQKFIEHGCCRFSQIKTKIRANPLYLRQPRFSFGVISVLLRQVMNYSG
jgi:hypothetical protein